MRMEDNNTQLLTEEEVIYDFIYCETVEELKDLIEEHGTSHLKHVQPDIRERYYYEERDLNK